MSLAPLSAAIGWPGAATPRDATLRIAFGGFDELVAWNELAATLLTIIFMILFVRFARGVHRERMLERERKVVPFANDSLVLRGKP